ncbi:MAG: hypothetical protein PHG06_00035 [Parabacteroides sp.]|nr:hypothetical protein [Parabacteroides sp.]
MFENKTFSEMENTQKTYTLKLSELQLYFLYNAIDFTRANSIISKPYEELISYVETVFKEQDGENK